MRDYGEIMDLAIEAGHYSGYLDTAEQKKAAQVEQAYKARLRVFADREIRANDSAEAAITAVETDFDEMRAASDPTMHGLYDRVAADLTETIRREGGKKPWVRRAQRQAPIYIGVILAIIYFGTRWYLMVPIEQPVDTRPGMVARAEALDKLLRYSDSMDTRVRRGGLFKSILMWPLEPTETEVKGAGEMAAMIVGGGQFARAEELACGLPVLGTELTDADTAMFGKVTTYLRDTTTRWASPPKMTIIDALRKTYPCAGSQP